MTDRQLAIIALATQIKEDSNTIISNVLGKDFDAGACMDEVDAIRQAMYDLTTLMDEEAND